MKAEPIGEIVLRLSVAEARALAKDCLMFEQAGPQRSEGAFGVNCAYPTREMQRRLRSCLEAAIEGVAKEDP